MPRLHGTFNNLREAVHSAILIHLETVGAILHTYTKTFLHKYQQKFIFGDYLCLSIGAKNTKYKLSFLP